MLLDEVLLVLVRLDVGSDRKKKLILMCRQGVLLHLPVKSNFQQRFSGRMYALNAACPFGSKKRVQNFRHICRHGFISNNRKSISLAIGILSNFMNLFLLPIHLYSNPLLQRKADSFSTLRPVFACSEYALEICEKTTSYKLDAAQFEICATLT
jgi:hypothetical protein